MNRPWLLVFGLIIGIVVAGAIFYPLVTKPPVKKSSENSEVNVKLKQLQAAWIAYYEANDVILPHETWNDKIVPYLESGYALHDPTLPSNQRFGFSLNKAVKPGINMEKSKDTVLFFQSDLTGMHGVGDMKNVRLSESGMFSYITVGGKVLSSKSPDDSSLMWDAVASPEK